MKYNTILLDAIRLYKWKYNTNLYIACKIMKPVLSI